MAKFDIRIPELPVTRTYVNARKYRTRSSPAIHTRLMALANDIAHLSACLDGGVVHYITFKQPQPLLQPESGRVATPYYPNPTALQDTAVRRQVKVSYFPVSINTLTNTLTCRDGAVFQRCNDGKWRLRRPELPRYGLEQERYNYLEIPEVAAPQLMSRSVTSRVQYASPVMGAKDPVEMAEVPEFTEPEQSPEVVRPQGVLQLRQVGPIAAGAVVIPSSTQAGENGSL